MKKHRSIIYLFIAFLACFIQQAGAQNLSNKGREFWVGYGHHQFMESGTNTQEMVLYLSAEAQAATVKVSLNGTAWSRTYFVPANSVISTGTTTPIAGTPGAGPFTAAPIPKAGTYDARLYTVPCGFLPPGTACGGEGQFSNKGLHIESDVPIVAYAHIYGSASSGATMLMPVETWGYSYITLNSKQNYAANCFSWAYVIAQQNNTVVEITPSQTTRFPRTANVPFTVTLNKGDIYQIMAGPETGSSKPEFSGTKFKSIANAAGVCYPVAVFAGSSRTSNPFACGSGGGDNDNQQCFPSQAWGKRYLTTPTSSSTIASTFMTNAYKIAVKDPTTVVKRNGVQIPLATLQSGTYYYYESSTADYIESDKPVMVAQYMTGGSCMSGGVGDPEMMYISPIEQGIKRIGFFRNNLESIQVNYLTLTIPTAGLLSLSIDGSSTFNHTYPHPNLPGYTVVVKRWSAAQAQSTARSDSAFTAITYGLGSVESYGYNAGTLINNLNAVGSIRNTSDTSAVASHPFTCTNTPVKLSVLLGYPTPPTRLVWQLSLVGGGLSPNTDVTVNGPVPVGTQLVNGVTYSKYELPGTYTFTTADTFRIPILATHPSIENCNNTEAVFYDMIVKDNPTSNFNFTHSGCVLDSVQFSGISPAANGYAINQWAWSFPDATTDNRQTFNKLFTTPGTKAINLKVVSVEGCVGDTTRDIIIHPKPLAAIAPAGAVCEGTAVTLTSNATFTGTAPINSYYWNFGDGTVVTVPTNAPQTHTYAAPGNYTVKHVAGVSTACVSDTATIVINVNAKPTTAFSYPAGCLPATGVVQFTSNASTPDGQAVTGHSWNFGDPASGASNTSTLANPTHTYPTFGNYTITYRATTANGCFKDTTVNATFNLAPTFNYPTLTSVCGNTTTPVSVATATVTNGVPGAGIYSGPGTSATGSFNPTVAGPGSHVIWYVFTTTAGCKDSVSQTIAVSPTPDPSFAITTAACLPASGIVPFNYTGTALPGQTYSWTFGDAASGAANTSTLASPSHTYATGTYTIRLSVTANGCTRDSVVTNTFNITPALAYPALPAVCESLTGTVSVATATVTNNVPGTGAYSGAGVDAAGNFNPSAAGPGTHTITYTFTGTGNCVSTITSSITVNPKPTANFTYPTAACLPASGLAQFTYTGTMSAGQTYLWNFGDATSGAANTSTLANPTHTYTNTGSYTVTVTVTNTNGCSDDHSITTPFSVTPALAYPALTAVCESVLGTVSVATATVTNGVLGTGVYSGPGVTSAGAFSPSTAGPGTHTITYTFTSTGNCVSTITSSITVNPKPTANFTYPTVACLPASGLAQFTYTGTMSAGQTYLWNFGDAASGAANTSTLANPTHTYTNTGSYTVTVTVTNTNGCSDDHFITTPFSVTPSLAYPALTAVCESVVGTVSVATATVTNGVLGSGVYSGPGVTSAGAFSPSTAGPGTHTITYTFTSTGNCVSTITSSITVNPKPTANFTYPTAACLPASGLAQFTYTGTMSAGQTYLWNFGDATSGAANTSTLANPTHTYTNTGSYTVTVTVTNTNGCSDDHSITTPFSVTPALAYPALTAVCESVAGTVSVATATVTNGVLGSGVYSGPGVTSAGAFSPSTAGPGTHTITYTFTSTGNCVSTITSSITVNPKPVAAFTISSSVCVGQQALITDNSTVPGGTITSWQWIFGDGNTVTYTNNAPFSYQYATYGTYQVKLVTTAANGCISDTARQTITVNAVPVASFTMPSSVCMPAGTVTFTNTSTVADGESLVYLWNLGDGTTSTAVSPTHVYASGGSYTVTLRVTGGNGCFKDTTQVFDKFFDKPIALFDVNTKNLCQGEDNVFTDMSTAPNSTIKSRLWIFGDGTTSSATNPVKRYNNPGIYTVKLVVINNENCISDTFPQTITVYLQPVVDAGPSFVVAQGTVVRFQPVVNDSSATTSFLWTPATGLSSPTALRPVLTATQDQTYTLTATGEGNCTASDILTVKILRPVKIPNAFSPNGDGTNDTWEIENLSDYTGVTVEVYNRYGQLLYTSLGYNTPWDGTTKGRPLPVATYYYIIQLKNGFKPLSGSITIIR